MYRPQLTALLLAATIPAAAQHTLRGRVLEGESPVGYATTVLLRDGRQAAGTTTDDAGGFVLTADTGRYTLVLRHVAYRPFEQEVCVAAADTDLGDLPLAPLGISEVTVTAETVTRQADRFVVSIGNTPALAGQDGTELLARAPGVWLGDNGISINGAGGTKVYVDGRELKGSAEETTTYLRSLTAADIARIEVMPLAGTEFAADTRGGAILITLRRRRDGGMDGNLQFSTVQSNRIAGYTPSGRIGIRTGRWTLTASGSGSFTPVAESRFTETREQAGQPLPFAGRSDSKSRTNYGRGHFSAVFDPTPKHTAGFDIEYTERSTHMPTLSRTTLGQTQSDSRYRQHMDGNTLTATANYIWKIDTLGSQFKLIADYTRYTSDGDNSYHTTTCAPGTLRDSLYESATGSVYDILTADAGLTRKLPHGLTLRAGLRYTRNDMADKSRYAAQTQGTWLALPEYSYDQHYTEQIGAAYASLEYSAGRWELSAGLRGEYTSVASQAFGRSYFGLFPNVSVSRALNALRTWLLVAVEPQHRTPGIPGAEPRTDPHIGLQLAIGQPLAAADLHTPFFAHGRMEIPLHAHRGRQPAPRPDSRNRTQGRNRPGRRVYPSRKPLHREPLVRGGERPGENHPLVEPLGQCRRGDAAHPAQQHRQPCDALPDVRRRHLLVHAAGRVLRRSRLPCPKPPLLGQQRGRAAPHALGDRQKTALRQTPDAFLHPVEHHRLRLGVRLPDRRHAAHDRHRASLVGALVESRRGLEFPHRQKIPRPHRRKCSGNPAQAPREKHGTIKNNS